MFLDKTERIARAYSGRHAAGRWTITTQEHPDEF